MRAKRGGRLKRGGRPEGIRGKKKVVAETGWDAETGCEARRKKRPDKKLEAETG